MEKSELKPFKEFKITERQQKIIKGLRDQSFSTENLANMYIGALKVLEDESNPERIYQSAHSLRELGRCMTDHINKATKTNNTHKEKMKEIISQSDELGGIDKEVIVKQWNDLHNYFVALCHHGSNSQIKDFEENLLKIEYILFALLGPVYETIQELDRLINIENPSKKDMELVPGQVGAYTAEWMDYYGWTQLDTSTKKHLTSRAVWLAWLDSPQTTYQNHYRYFSKMERSLDLGVSYTANAMTWVIQQVGSYSCKQDLSNVRQSLDKHLMIGAAFMLVSYLGVWLLEYMFRSIALSQIVYALI